MFNRDIRPILSDRCFRCHGPDEKKREADLRFDLEHDAKKDLGGYHAIVPGDLAESVLIDRITAVDADERMPPEESGTSLSSQEIDLLKQWIAEGAHFENHWSFQYLKQPHVPEVNDVNWPRNELDYFIVANLEAHGVRPSPAANRNTLMRRLSLDLTGLPPTPEEVSSFVNDRSHDAYDNYVAISSTRVQR